MRQLCLAILIGVIWVDACAEASLPRCPTEANVVWTTCYGTYTWPNGQKYVGEFKDDNATGQGTMTSPDGSETYVGQFKEGLRDGQGTNTWSNGQEYVGNFKDDKYNGQGTLIFPDGRRYVGTFKDGKPSGQGTYTYTDGRVESGRWEDGKFVRVLFPTPEHLAYFLGSIAGGMLIPIAIFLLIRNGLCLIVKEKLVGGVHIVAGVSALLSSLGPALAKTEPGFVGGGASLALISFLTTGVIAFRSYKKARAGKRARPPS